MTVLTSLKMAENKASQPVHGNKPRSGYARKKLEIARLYQRIEHLQADHAQLQADYSELEAAFAELKALNSSLVDDLRRSRSNFPASSKSIFGGLMHGR